MNRYLLDTHVVLWALVEPQLLSSNIKTVLEDGQNQLFMSAISLWEISLKRSVGKLDIKEKVISNLLTELENTGITIVSPKDSTYLKFAELPRLNTDPFDRILVAQAIFEDYALVSVDKNIRQYKKFGLKLVF